MKPLLAALCATILALPVAYADTYSILHNFESTDGTLPASLTLAPDGTIYGRTVGGGDTSCQSNTSYSGCGTIFALSPAGLLSTLTELGQITVPQQNAAPLFLSKGKLYGTSPYGRSTTSGVGSVYSLRIGALRPRILHVFVSTEGGLPLGRIAVDNKDNIYGTIYGSQDESELCACIYRLAPDGTFTPLHIFRHDSPATDNPNGVILVNGFLYGTVLSSPNGPIVYSYNTVTGAYAVLATLPNTDRSYNAQLFGADARGNLYGFSQGIGPTPTGALFELLKSRNGYTLTTLHVFDLATGGATPVGATLAPSGAIFGTTMYGPDSGGQKMGGGTLFSFANNTYTTLQAFDPGPGFTTPQTGLFGGGAPVVTTAGAIIGPTLYGGDTTCTVTKGPVRKGCGTIFQYTP